MDLENLEYYTQIYEYLMYCFDVTREYVDSKNKEGHLKLTRFVERLESLHIHNLDQLIRNFHSGP